jgi:hypothetical protein
MATRWSGGCAPAHGVGEAKNGEGEAAPGWEGRECVVHSPGSGPRVGCLVLGW